jgi:NAD(P)-dependent dehydrogenase (short-subunit alcohol dehydrogenase family)
MSNAGIFDLSDRIAIVTGGSQGIGFAIASGLARFSAKVVISNRKANKGGEAAEAIRKEGGYAIHIPVDVLKKESVQEMIEKTMNRFGRIDILVNDAGVIFRKQPEEISKEDLDYIIDTNLKGVFLCAQEAGKQMIKQKRGKIINISSIGADCALELRSAYCASKGGVSQLTKALALDWAKYNINVNAIAPGGILTDMNRDYFMKETEKYDQLVRRVCLGRHGEPKDIVGMAIFLASDASDYVTGQTIYIDGGYTIF